MMAHQPKPVPPPDFVTIQVNEYDNLLAHLGLVFDACELVKKMGRLFDPEISDDERLEIREEYDHWFSMRLANVPSEVTDRRL
jgi:hypothetical protein